MGKSIATCGHKIDGGISTSKISGFGDSLLEYGTYCAECILAYHKNGELKNKDLESLCDRIVFQERELSFIRNEKRYLIEQAKKELTVKDQRISHLEKECTRLFEPTRAFWNEEVERMLSIAINHFKIISQPNKHDGNAPKHYGPESMEYWKWQELISRDLAREALDKLEEISK